MTTGIRAKVKDQLDELVQIGSKFLDDYRTDRNSKEDDSDEKLFRVLWGYQTWYTRALTVIRHLIPERLDEFESLYRGRPRKENQTSSTGYGIDDFLLGVRVKRTELGRTVGVFDHDVVVYMKIHQQGGQPDEEQRNPQRTPLLRLGYADS